VSNFLGAVHLAIRYTQHQAQGKSLAFLTLLVTFLAAYTFHTIGENPLHFKYAILIAVCFVLGGYLGTRIAFKMFVNK